MGEVRIVPYEGKYKRGVIECLKRNYTWMSEVSNEYLEKWLQPITDYSWSGDREVSIIECQYKYGAIILDDDFVKGYLGMITSYQTDLNGNKYLYGSPTTWAIDEKYRIYLSKAIKKLVASVDFMTEFTARESVEAIMSQIFKFTVCENDKYLLYPCPYEGEDHCITKRINKLENIDDALIKNVYFDHSPFYGINLVKADFGESTEHSYVFYKRYDEKDARLRILYISNPQLFAAYAHEIVWDLLKKEFYNGLSLTDTFIEVMGNIRDGKMICVECSKMLLNEAKLNYPVCRNVKERILIQNSNNIDHSRIDYMYSEISNLSCKV